MNNLSAIKASLASCHFCCQLSKSENLPAKQYSACPRCGGTLHFRKPNSISRTWALILAASILYIPANILPVMRVTWKGGSDSDTILSGIMGLMEEGMWLIALIIFVASILIPMLKIISLIFLLISVQIKSSWCPKDRTMLYRVVEGVGRWSMIDIYVISIMVALVQLGAVATVEPELGAVFFASVVVITMFASISFDPRLIWDSFEESNR